MKARGVLAIGAFLASLVGDTFAVSNTPSVDGVFGLSRVTPRTYMAAWVPLESGSVVIGVSWYQNDEQVVFPEILAAAGALEWPCTIASATHLLQDVGGASSSWNEARFLQPITSDSGGLYLIFQIPPGDPLENVGFGGGFGIGYFAGDGVRRCWLSGDGENWNPVRPDWQLAVVPVLDASKARTDALVLRREDAAQVLADAAPQVGQFELAAHPNPFNPRTEIQFVAAAAGLGHLAIYDLRGHFVVQLFGGPLSAGRHSVVWSGVDQVGRQVASGVYFARLRLGSLSTGLSIVLVR